MDKIFIFGAGPHSNVIIDIVEKEGKYEIVGLIDSKRPVGSSFNKYKIVGRQEQLIVLIKKYGVNKGIVAVGDNFLRSKLANLILTLSPNFTFINAIHPSVIIGKYVKFGVGNVFMPGVIINTYAEIKNHCILNTNSFLEHNCLMENFSSIAPGVTMGGFVKIKEYSAIAVGVIIRDRICIKEHTVVGSGSVVIKDIPSYCIAYGSPAKKIRNREAGETYLK